MAATIDATVGGSAANSYVLLTEADAYHETQLNVSDWTSADTDTKNRALILATRLLDDLFEWQGSPAASTQALQWPRLGVVGRNGLLMTTDVIPSWLKNAQAELAKWCIASDRTSEQTNLEFTHLEAGPLVMDIDRTYRKPTIPDVVVSMVKFYGRYLSGTGAVRLVRT